MHVMEDVEEGCNVSGALPSSPGHAEQRPDPPKEITQVPATETDTPVTNGLPAGESAESNTAPSSPVKSEPESPEPAKKEPSTEKTGKKDATKAEDEQQQDEGEEEEGKKEMEVQESVQDNDDSNSNDSENSTNKRKCEEDDTPAKRLRTQIQQQYIVHDKVLSEYLESTGCNNADDLQANSEQLIAEIRTLNELAREKEREWNNILHLKKVKEELLLRMQRRRQIILLNSEKSDNSQPEFDDIQLAEMMEKNKDGLKNNSGLMMVPIVSSSPANSRVSSMSGKSHSKPRSILPKPGFNAADFNGSQSIECRQGRQGPILDVRSIIADYRQRHPETVPRRGRRLKSVLNSSNHGETVVTTSGKLQGGTSVLNMTNLGLGSGSQVRHNDVGNELGLLLSTMDTANKEGSRPSSADSSSAANILGTDPTVSFKDVLVQFARLSQSERQELQAQAAAGLAAASKPTYPEVTLHPVPTAATATVTQNNPSSLLHNILTKSQGKTDPNKPTTFSPTLARLLTAPERVSSNNAQAVYNAAAAALNSGVSISDLLTANTKSRNEITITPIGQYGQNAKHKDADNVGDEDEAEDSADRLVIDEGGQESGEGRQRTDNGSEMGDEVPQCQGCHQKAAQFVCAGCGNQWYCSRDCQVQAWDEHSEVCSG